MLFSRQANSQKTSVWSDHRIIILGFAILGAFGSACPEAVIDERDLRAVIDPEILGKLLDEVISENPIAVAELREGNEEPINYWIGQVMKKTGGRTHSGTLNKIIVINSYKTSQSKTNFPLF